MENQISTVLQEERAERALRKAEMEATKAKNMIRHKDETYSRPKETWFATEKEKKLLAKAAKTSLDQQKSNPNEVISAQQAEELKLKEKRKREREKNLPRKKRRKLEAAREMLENEEDDNTTKEKGGGKNKEPGQSLVDVGYRRAKAMKSTMKTRADGKSLTKGNKRANEASQKNLSRKEEMLDLFQNDMSERKQARAFKKSNSAPGRKSKSSYKSKSRYKRR